MLYAQLIFHYQKVGVSVLILSRRDGETIRVEIGPNRYVTVTVLRSKIQGEAKLGITAPPDVIVHREEVWERIEKGKPR